MLTGTVQVLSSLVSCVSSGCKVAAGDGLETAQWHTVVVCALVLLSKRLYEYLEWSLA